MEVFGGFVDFNRDGYFNATQLSYFGSMYRMEKGKSIFNLSQMLNYKTNRKFIEHLSIINNKEMVIKHRGRSAGTWVHPLIFVFLITKIDKNYPITKLEGLRDILFVHTKKYVSGRRYLIGVLHDRNQKSTSEDLRRIDFKVLKYSKCESWESATPLQLERRDEILGTIGEMFEIIPRLDDAVRMGIKKHEMNLKFTKDQNKQESETPQQNESPSIKEEAAQETIDPKEIDPAESMPIEDFIKTLSPGEK